MSDAETKQETASALGACAEETEPHARPDEAVQERPPGSTSAAVMDAELYRQLGVEVEELAKRVRALAPNYEPPPFSPKGLAALVEALLSKYPREVQLRVLDRLRGALRQDAFDPDTWKSAWIALNYTLQSNTGLVRRHLTGRFDTDEWGLDREFVDLMRPIFGFLYNTYWRVETTGLENIPSEGRALLVANHSGLIPWDGAMLATAVLIQHPARRLVRALYAALWPSFPIISTLVVRLGHTLATPENGTRLLEQDELVAVFPEAHKGTSKPFKDRYRLARFGRGGFIKMALATGAPIIPVSVIGNEETYITLGKVPLSGRSAGVPYFPVTLTFPWLGPLGFVPLPTKWYIDIGEPIPVEEYGPDTAQNVAVVSQLADQVRNTIQDMVNQRLAQRRSMFFG